MIGGHRRSFTAGNKKEVLRAAKDAKDHYDAVENDAAEMPLRDALEQYISDRSEILSLSTIRGYRQIAKTKFPALMQLRVKDIAPDRWQREIYADVKKVCENMGIENVGIHGLRHSFASLSAHLKLPEQECMSLGGWSNPTVMREVYTHVAAVDKAGSESALKAFFKQ